MDLFANETSDWAKIEDWATRSSQLFLKKLSRNDTSWADSRGKHQAGFYIPKEVRESGFFPPLSPNPDKPHILQAPCVAVWPQTGEVKPSGIRHYTRKGPETHFTVIPRELFTGLSPASLLLAGKLREPMGEITHWLIVLDSSSSDAELLETSLEIPAGFHFSLFDPNALALSRQLAVDEEARLIDELRHAIRNRTLDRFIADVSRIPPPEVIAGQARQTYMASHGLRSLSPWDLPAPGDAVMTISRDVEYQVFKHYELRRRGSEIVRLLIGEPELVSAVIRGFPYLDAVFLSASQQRKTRAGRSFEFHLASLLRDGGVRFQEQAVLGGRRPDFVLPSSRALKRADRTQLEALILSAKTTLRERWKQLNLERFNCDIYLGTVDDRVSRSTLNEMQALGVTLVVPESLKSSKEAHYAKHPTVISFRTFFDDEIRGKRSHILLQ